MTFTKALTGWKIVVVTITATIPLILWGLDTRYITKMDLVHHSINKLYDEIASLEIKKGMSSKEETNLLDMNIVLKKNRINKLKGDHL